MAAKITQRIQTPGFIKAVEWVRRQQQRFISAPVKKRQEAYRLWAAYTQARQAVKVLKKAPETRSEFRSRLGASFDDKYLIRYLGEALAEHSEEWFYRGRVLRSSQKAAAEMVNYVLASKFSIHISTDLLENALLVEGTTPMQVGLFSGARDLFWSLAHFPFYGFYLKFVEPLLYHLASNRFNRKYDLEGLREEIEKDLTRIRTGGEVIEEAGKLMARKHEYVTKMVDAVIDLMAAAAKGMSVEDLQFYACRRIVEAIPFMTRALLFKVVPIDGVNKARALAWAGKPGIPDMIVRAQAKLMGGKLIYDLLRDRPGRLGGVLPAVDSTLLREIAREMGVGAEEEAGEFGEAVRFTTDITDQVAGTTTLVALSILDNRPFICYRLDMEKMYREGLGEARDMITGEIIYPNPIGMRALNVFEFFCAPFEEGALLGAVDLPRDYEEREILYIMEAYQAYARILGQVIQSRLLQDRLVDAREREKEIRTEVERLAQALSRFAPAEALLKLGRATDLGFETRPYVTAFVDLMGSTAIDRSFQANPTIPHRARNDVFELVQECLAPVQGQAFAFMGDAILGGISAASFGESGKVEIQPEHVMKMIASLVQVARKLSHFNRADRTVRYQLKMAVHGGEVSVGVLGSKEKGAYTLIGYPVDINARVLAVHSGWSKNAPLLGCRVGENTTLPIIITEPMMAILFTKVAGRQFLMEYVADFNEYILSDLLGRKIYARLVEMLTPAASSAKRPLADVIFAALEYFGREGILQGFRPLHLTDLLKGPFDLTETLGGVPRGMEGDKLAFRVLEWDMHAYHPKHRVDFERAKRIPMDMPEGLFSFFSPSDFRFIPS